MIPPTILALAESGPLAAAAIVIGGIVLNLIAENVLEPTLTGRALSLSTWLVFTCSSSGSGCSGRSARCSRCRSRSCVVLVLQHNERTQWVAALLAATPATEQPVDAPSRRTGARGAASVRGARE